ncbi:AraC family transcriptional regulator [Mesorhizobium sp. KR9-304]|uniref:AraC family transcriptional regulator n=1 Tax=Mesorhizobium sp. KR9-304 TaxID=3156614 RepID=UPI0032B451C1
MNPVAKALWFIESHLDKDITLDDVAEASGVSRFHMSRAFGDALDKSVMRYVRARRLTEAALQLADGAPDILSVALDAGYGSHEAFTRAFREQFGLTPEQLRSEGQIETILLVEANLMDTDQTRAKLEKPRFVDAKPMMVAGIGARFEYGNMDGIPAQWQRFNQHIGSIPGAIDGAAYGVCTASDANGFDYISAVEVSSFSDLDPTFMRVRIPAQRYAVFSHCDHISTIRTTMRAIWSEWLPHSGREIEESPTLERYGPEFDPRSGNGGLEVWLPVKR